MQLSKLETTPCEVLEQIVLRLVATSFLGPPNEIIPLLLLSKHVWSKLALSCNSYLYACIFALKFDVRAPLRRLKNKPLHVELSTELVKRFQTLKRFKEASYMSWSSPELRRNDLWTAYSMFLESDGKNSMQLINYAAVDRFASEFVSFDGLLHNGAEMNGGWTIDSEENALALWLFWFTDKYRVLSETPAQRRMILRALAPLFVGSFKYALTYFPITLFDIQHPVSSSTPSRLLSPASSPISASCRSYGYFGSELKLTRPLLVPPALLSSVVRLEVSISEINWPPSTRIPATREDAVAAGWSGPTQEDHNKQKVPTTRFMEWGGNMSDDVSERHEHDWMRLRSCYEPSTPGVFTPGMLDGVWVGRWFGIPVNHFNDLLESERMGQPLVVSYPPLVYPVPMQFRLREYHQHTQGDVDFDDITREGTGRGVLNAWLPNNTSIAHVDGALKVSVPGRKTVTYHTCEGAYAAQAALNAELARAPYGNGVWDIILTAETDEEFAEAWGHKQYHGRVRSRDGLILLVRTATETEGRWIFRGYLHGMQNLVGTWREAGTPISMPALEGVWSMTKMDVI